MGNSGPLEGIRGNGEWGMGTRRTREARRITRHFLFPYSPTPPLPIPNFQGSMRFSLRSEIPALAFPQSEWIASLSRLARLMPRRVGAMEVRDWVWQLANGCAN